MTLRIRAMTRVAALALLACLVTACTLGPVWAPRVEGRVVDVHTGRPIAGALVVAYHPHAVAMTHQTARLGLRTTRTDADGRFVLDGKLELILDFGSTAFFPEVKVTHPEYETASESSFGPRSGEIRMKGASARFPDRDLLIQSLYELDPLWLCSQQEQRPCPEAGSSTLR